MSGMLSNGSSSSDNGDETRWEGYSDYQRVSDRVARSIYDAIEAFAIIDSQHTENARVKPAAAAKARAKILAPALRLKVEMEADREAVEKLDQILQDWEGDEGHLAKFSNLQLHQDCPSWLHEFVTQIREAGWEIGYLKAGRTTKKELDDEVEEEVKNMFGKA